MLLRQRMCEIISWPPTITACGGAAKEVNWPNTRNCNQSSWPDCSRLDPSFFSEAIADRCRCWYSCPTGAGPLPSHYCYHFLWLNLQFGGGVHGGIANQKGDCSLKGATSRSSRRGVWLRLFWIFVFQDRVAEVVKNWRLIFGAQRSDHKSRAIAVRLATPIFQNCIRRDISHALCIHCWGELILHICAS